MKANIRITNDIQTEKWNELLKSAPNATVFHTKEWAEVITKTYPARKKLYIVAEDDRGKLLGMMPLVELVKFGFHNYLSLPLDGYGGPITIGDQDENLKEKILFYFSGLGRGWRHGLLRTVDFSEQCKILEKYGFQRRRCFTHLLHLNTSFESVWKNKFSRNVRKIVRQAKRKGVCIEEVKNLDDVKAYYEIAVHTSKRRGVIPYPVQIYENIFKYMQSQGLVKWHLAKCNGLPIAGTIHFVFKDSILSWLNASYQHYWHLRPNNLLVSSIIEWGCENGMQMYNFGASPPSATELIRFKESWGAEKKFYDVYEKKSFILKVLYPVKIGLDKLKGRL